MNPWGHQHGARKGLVDAFLILGLFLGVMALAEEPWDAPERWREKQNPIPAEKEVITAGKRLYQRECLSCHGNFGRGDGPAAKGLDRLPGDLADPQLMEAQTDGELFWKITEGRKPMPSFKKALSEEERWRIVHYLRTLVKKREQS